MPDATFFKTPAELHQWLDAHHNTAAVLWIGFYKKSAGTTGISYSEALDEALTFGWVDGVRKSVDANRYTIRFSPRRPKSVWSLVNINRVKELIEQGRMQPAGLKAYEQHDLAKAEQHTYVRTMQPLAASYESLFQTNAQAWRFFQAQAPFYRQSATWWVMSAKQDATRLRRLEQLIEASAKEQRLPQLLGKAKGNQ